MTNHERALRQARRLQRVTPICRRLARAAEAQHADAAACWDSPHAKSRAWLLGATQHHGDVAARHYAQAYAWRSAEERGYEYLTEHGAV